MATDLRGHTVPAGNEAPSRGALTALGLSIRDAIPVANATARTQRIADLAAVGVVATTAEPFFFWRADAHPGAQLEQWDGTEVRTHYAASPRVSGTMSGAYSGQPVFPWLVNGSKEPNASGDFEVLSAAALTGFGVVGVSGHSASIFDLIYAFRISSGALMARVWNTAGAVVTANHAYTITVHAFKI